MSVIVRMAAPADAPAIGEVLARAFANDSVTSWVTPDAQRRTRLLRRLDTAIARYEAIPRGMAYVATREDTIVGASIWRPPGRSRPRVRSATFALVAGVALGPDIPRTVSAGRAAARARPRQRHWYLQLLGVDPGMQGEGVGGELVRSQLRVVDEQQMPAALETTGENLGFYREFGFEVVGEIVIGRGAPVEWSLVRGAT